MPTYEEIKHRASLKEIDARWCHRLLCSVYGWIPIEEFYEMSIPAVLYHVDLISQDYEKMKKKKKK